MSEWMNEMKMFMSASRDCSKIRVICTKQNPTHTDSQNAQTLACPCVLPAQCRQAKVGR